jgi:glucuronoarabinoxylan endo-1,4-beta-xylanase
MRRFRNFAIFHAMVFFLLTASFSYSAETITIDRNTTYQKIWGFGGAANHPVEDLKTDFSAAAQKELLDLLFGTDGSSAGLSIIRLEINGFKEGQTDPNGAKQWTCEPADGVWDWDSDPYQRWFSAEAIKRSDIHFMAMPWSPPSWMKDNGSVINGGSLKPEVYDKFVTYIKTYVSHYRNDFGIDIRWVNVQNEPSNKTSYASCVYSNSALNEVTGKLADAIHGLNQEIMVGGPEGATRGISLGFLNGMTTDTKSKLDFILTHDYGGANSSLAGFGKPVINTEVWSEGGEDMSITDGIRWANEISDALNRGEPGWLFWWILSPAGSGNAQALVDLNGNSGYTLKKRLFTMGHFSRWMRLGDLRIKGSSTNGDLDVVCAKNDKDRAAIVVINNSSAALSATVKGLLGASAQVYRTSGSESMVKLANVAIANGSATVNFSGKSVTTIIEEITTQTDKPASGRAKTAASPLTIMNIRLYSSGNGATMRVNLSKESNMAIGVYALNGITICRTTQTILPAGASSVLISENALAAGAYYVRLEAGGSQWSQKVIVR